MKKGCLRGQAFLFLKWIQPEHLLMFLIWDLFSYNFSTFIFDIENSYHMKWNFYFWIFVSEWNWPLLVFHKEMTFMCFIWKGVSKFLMKVLIDWRGVWKASKSHFFGVSSGLRFSFMYMIRWCELSRLCCS